MYGGPVETGPLLVRPPADVAAVAVTLDGATDGGCTARKLTAAWADEDQSAASATSAETSTVAPVRTPDLPSASLDPSNPNDPPWWAASRATLEGLTLAEKLLSAELLLV